MTRYELIKRLKTNKVVKEEYLKRLETSYTKNGLKKSFKEQYMNAEGHELEGKFYSGISSSRLCFELFSWMAEDEVIKDIEFECYLPGLKSANGHKVPQPNMDVYYDDGNINFIESKFTETSNNLKDSISKNYYDYYLDGSNNVGKQVLEICKIRFDGNIIFAKHFITLINNIITYAEEKNLFGKKDWFDLKQEVTHIFGIGQYIYKEHPKKSIHFTNLVYDFNYPISNLTLKFNELTNNMMKKYIGELGLSICFKYDFKYMQEYVKTIDLNRNAYASNKTIKEILSEFYL